MTHYFIGIAETIKYFVIIITSFKKSPTIPASDLSQYKKKGEMMKEGLLPISCFH